MYPGVVLHFANGLCRIFLPASNNKGALLESQYAGLSRLMKKVFLFSPNGEVRRFFMNGVEPLCPYERFVRLHCTFGLCLYA